MLPYLYLTLLFTLLIGQSCDSVIEGEGEAALITAEMQERVESLEEQRTHKPTKSKCTFFAGTRYSVPESSLVNCYWYNRNACCKRIEVTSVFNSLLDNNLKGHTKKCYDMLRYLLCYFCSPEQHYWFKDNKVFVCKSFCDDIYANCRTASVKNVLFSKAFKTGVEFCNVNNFAVQEENINCFAFDPSQFDGAASLRPPPRWLLALTVAAGSLLAILFAQSEPLLPAGWL